MSMLFNRDCTPSLIFDSLDGKRCTVVRTTTLEKAELDICRGEQEASVGKYQGLANFFRYISQ